MYSFHFSHNWNNKLLCDYFTTLRLNREFIQVGHVYPFTFKTVAAGTVRVIDKRIVTVGSITDGMCRIDTGYSKPETVAILKKMYTTQFAEHGEHLELAFHMLQVETRETDTFEILLRDGMKRFDKLLQQVA